MYFVIFEEPKISVREKPPEVIVAPTFIDAIASPKNQERLEGLTLTLALPLTISITMLQEDKTKS